MARNLAVYAWFLPLSRVHFATPVFFLYFGQRFSIQEVLALESIYYASVVLLEVPSGYFSDRVGRRATLLISTLAMAGAYALFLLGGTSFTLFAFAQIGVAVHFAFISGTDTSLHFDTLAALDREAEYGDREARLTRNAYLAAAAGAVLAGVLSVADLRIAYALAFGNAAVLLVLVLAMREPPRRPGGWAHEGFVHQLSSCLGLLRRPFLLWLFAYFVLKITTEHVPYEFSQPYLAAVLDEPVSAVRTTPAASGLLLAVIAAVGSVAATWSMELRRRFGTAGTLLGVGGVQIAVIWIMGAVISPLVLGLLALRSQQAAIANVVIHAEVTPRVPQARRATYLSLHSLAGRLGYAVVLAGLSALAAGESIDDPGALQKLLLAAGGLGTVGLVVLFATVRALRERVVPAPEASG